MNNYVTEALRTLKSGNINTDMVEPAEFFNALHDAIIALQQLDVAKKRLFYRKDAAFDYEMDHGQVNVNWDKVPADIVHGVVGVATEAGEMLEALALALFDTPEFDEVNLVEEIGDVFWYLAILANATKRQFSDIQQINIDKLRKRYPDKFTETLAIERDVKAERKLLENATRDSSGNESS